MAAEINTDFSFYDIIPSLPPLQIVDVGALPLQDSPEVYASLLERGKVRLHAFEADQAGCESLTTALGPKHNVFPLIIGDGEEKTFHQNKHAMTSSLFPPNIELADKFVGLADFMQPVESHIVQTHRLDDTIDLQSIDFLKMDVQGGELLVLDGAPRLAASALAVQTEVEFVPLYRDQPLFADIDTRLRSLEFQFHTFTGFGTRSYKPLKRVGTESEGLNQFLWADAIYVPDFSKLDVYSDERLLKLVVILHDLYQSVDLALHILAVLRDRDVKEPLLSYTQKLGFG